MCHIRHTGSSDVISAFFTAGKNLQNDHAFRVSLRAISLLSQCLCCNFLPIDQVNWNNVQLRRAALHVTAHECTEPRVSVRPLVGIASVTVALLSYLVSFISLQKSSAFCK